MKFDRSIFDQIIALPYTDHRNLDCVEECQEALGRLYEDNNQFGDFFDWDVPFLRQQGMTDADIIKFLERMRMADIFTG